MADKRLDQTTNASAVAAADNIPFVTAAGVTSYVTGDELAASGPFSSRYAPLLKTTAAANLDNIVAWDSFNRANGAVGTSDSGHVWTAHSGTWNVASNQLECTNTDATARLVTLDPGLVNFDMSVRMRYVDDTRQSVVFRFVDSSNFLRLFLRNTGFNLQKVVAGTPTDLATVANASLPVATSNTTTPYYPIRIVAVDARIVIFCYGAQVLAHTLTGGDETTFGSATPLGMGAVFAGSTTRRWDDLVVRSA